MNGFETRAFRDRRHPLRPAPKNMTYEGIDKKSFKKFLNPAGDVIINIKLSVSCVTCHQNPPTSFQFIYLGFYVTFNTVQVISRRVVERAEETSTYSSSGFCTVNCRPTASNYQLSHLRPCREPNPGLRDGRRECYHSATVAPHKFSSYFANKHTNAHGQSYDILCVGKYYTPNNMTKTNILLIGDLNEYLA